MICLNLVPGSIIHVISPSSCNQGNKTPKFHTTRASVAVISHTTTKVTFDHIQPLTCRIVGSTQSIRGAFLVEEFGGVC